MPSETVLHARLLGEPRFTFRGVTFAPPSRKVLALLGYLALRNGSVNRDHLAELLWSAGKLRNVRQALYELRQLPGAEVWLQEQADGVRVEAHSDVQRFETALARDDYAEAVACYQPLLADFRLDAPAFNDWSEVECRRLEALFRSALRGRARQLEQAAQPLGALESLHTLLELDPFDESAHRSVMRLEYSRGHLQAALAQYEQCRRAIIEGLRVEPLEETKKLAELIRQGRLHPAPSKPNGKRMPPQLLRPPTLLGREREWAQMEAAWHGGKAIFLTGAAGVGKTRLLLDFAASSGTYLLNEGRPGDVNIPFSSMARGLRRIHASFPDITLEPWVASALANVVPDVVPDATPNPLTKRVSTTQFIEAFVWLIKRLAQRVDALPCDDAHYFDSVSAQIGETFSAEWVEQFGEHRLITAFRDTEMPAQTLELVHAGASQGQSIVVRIEPLQVDTVTDLLASLEMPRHPHFAEQLHRYTGGNPTFIIETLKDLYRRDTLEPDVKHFEVPERISSLIGRNLDRLAPDALRLLRAVAVTQPYTTTELLAEVLGKDVFDVADALGRLEAKQYLQDVRFVHDLLFEAVQTHVPVAVLRLLHGRTAQALERSRGESVRIAYHWQQAGEPERSVPYWLAAAKSYYAAGLRENATELLTKLVPYAAQLEGQTEPSAMLPNSLQVELEQLISTPQEQVASNE